MSKPMTRRGMVAGIAVAAVLSATFASQEESFFPTFLPVLVVSLLCVAAVVGFMHLIARNHP